MAEAVDGAEVCFVCAPVGALPATVARGARGGGGDCVVTDVGSTKRAVLDGRLADDERFVGGHPLAGAEAAGRRARPRRAVRGRDLVPHADRAHERHALRAPVPALVRRSARARPRSPPTSHDRLMATVSHLPHVLANVLVGQAARALSEEAQRLPATGPSFRDATRVAGANPALWRDIFLANREAIVTRARRRRRRARRGARRPARRRRRALERWIDGARAIAGGCWRPSSPAAPVSELRVSVPNRPGIVAQIALALGRAGINIVDMALYPAPDRMSGYIILWVPGPARAEAEALVAGLGLPVARA